MDNRDYLKQIDQFYNKKLPSNKEIRLGNTPDVVKKYGVSDLPLVMRQSNVSKSIREPKGSRSGHKISRNIIEKLPEMIREPVLIINNPQKKGLVLLTEEKDFKERNVVVAIHSDCILYGKKVNEIKSIYGREELRDFLEREQKAGHVVYEDKEKVRKLSPTIEKQYLKAPINPNYENSIANPLSDVNSKKEKNTYAKPAGEIKKSDIVKDLKANGFQPTKSLVRNIRELNHLCGKGVSIKEIHDLYKRPDMLEGEAAKEAVNQIAAECRAQEMERLQIPPPEL